jgi:peroxiredoxin
MKTTIILAILTIGTIGAVAQGNFKVGQKAPDLEGETWEGKEYPENSPIGKHPVLLVFYQGSWNSYDADFIKELGGQYNAIAAKGYRVVLVSAEKAVFGQTMLDESELEAEVLYDEYLVNTSNYGYGLKLSKRNLPDKFEKHSAANRKHTGRKDNVVPVPACLVISPDGTIKWIHTDWDYRRRPSIEEVISQL